MRPFIRSLGRGERTVLLSSHLMSEVEQVCDRVGVISRGRLVSEGTMDELRGREGLWLRAEPSARPSGCSARSAASRRSRVTTAASTSRPSRAAASTINRALVEAGIAVGELRPDRASLEKVFLELTNEEEAA